jgi:hypothetical protein
MPKGHYPRKKKQFCLNGHDTFICGRDKTTRRCKECLKEYAKKRYKPRVRIKKKFCKNGHEIAIVGRTKSRACRECVRLQGIEREKLSKTKKVRKKYRDSHKAKSRQYQQEHSKELAEYIRQYYQDNKEKILEQTKKYHKEHPELSKLNNIKQTTNRNLRIVSWDQDGIREFYAHCPAGMVVDHILPLQGKKISGFHILSNLQYLTPADNLRKGNSWDGTLKNNGWRHRKILKDI